MNKYIFILFSSFIFGIKSFSFAEKPILTFGCMSDIHNQNSMINGSVSEVRLRQSFLTTLNDIKKYERVDLLVLGGDYTSDVTIDKANWLKVRQLMVEATRNVFLEGEPTPVIYASGNHDYEVSNFDALPKEWNASDFYTLPMKTDIGELDESDCYYEIPDNAGYSKQKILVAFHYVIKGFDFVVLNTGSYFFKSAWDYQNTTAAVQWVNNKLEQIFADDINKTVFFIHHLPLPDSNGVQSGKTLLSAAASTTQLKNVLLQYPNLIYLYGHDHSTRNSFITEETAQRVTEYTDDGSVINRINQQKTKNVTQDISDIDEGLMVLLKNTFTKSGEPLYVSVTGSSLSTSITPKTVFVISDGSGNGLYNIKTYTSGMFIKCSGTFTLTNSRTDIKLYRLTSSTTTSSPWVTGVRVLSKVKDLDLSDKYIIVANDGNRDYVMSNEPKGGVLGSSNSITYTNDSTFTYTSSTGWYNGGSAAVHGIIWDFISVSDEDIEEPNIESDFNRSFVSSFMGSMRYNSLNSNSSPGTSDSPIVQALMVYVYNDSIVLSMKNYGDTGLLSGSAITTHITDPLKPFVLNRKVTYSGGDYSANATSTLNYEGIVIFSDENNLIVKNTGVGTKLSINDVAGREIFYDVITQNVYTHPIKNYPAGLYIITLSGKEGVHSQKVKF